MSAVIAGYPTGAVLSGLIAAEIVPEYGWQTMYEIAGIATFITLPLIYFSLSESLDFYPCEDILQMHLKKPMKFC
ncbi:MAG: hypothetical protein R3B93_08800 [Bacteroidia bacterium]